jgi:hypothetical protein
VQINRHAQTFTLAGARYSWQLESRRVGLLGTSWDVVIRDQSGRQVAARPDVFLARDIPVEQALGPVLKSMMDGRPTLTDMRTAETAHSPHTDMGPVRPSLW